MDYEQKYKESLEKVRMILTDRDIALHAKEKFIDIFPELKENEDGENKRISKEIAQFLKQNNAWNREWLAWLEKQRKSDKSLYIRFGDIPINGKSKVYNGEIETGIEEGISVYPAFEDKEGNIILGLNLPITKTSLHTQQHLLEYDSRPCYLVTGDYVGKGTDGEPLIKNVKIIKEIKHYRIKQDKENNTYTINNTPNCGTSVYNEELKVSADDAIAWLEKQGQEPTKFSIWKHWKDGICGNGEGKQTYLIKMGNTYSLSSCLGFECDYIELSELDNLLEKQRNKYDPDKVIEWLDSMQSK